MSETYRDFLVETLQDSGARLTRPRKAILDVIAFSEQPLTTRDIFQLAQEKAPNIGLVTVYRTIDALESLGLVDRIHGNEDCQTVFRAAAGHRHLLTCTQCGKSVYIDGILSQKEFDQIGQEHGYAISGHLLQLFGTCENCNNPEGDKNE